jgi:hypothetical protein
MPSIPRRSLLRRVGATFVASVSALVPLIPSAAQADPTNVTPPVISGTLEYGQTLSATTGTWTDPSSPIVKYEYEWLNCLQSICQIIPDTNASTFTLPGSMTGLATKVGVIATDAEGKIMVASSEETDTITGPAQTASGTTVLPARAEAQPADEQPASGADAPEAGAAGASPSNNGVARLLAVHEVRHHIQAQVSCEQPTPCHLSLGVFASSVRHVLIARRSFTVAPERSAPISLALTRAGVRLARRRLPIVAVLTSSGSNATPLSESRITIT